MRQTLLTKGNNLQYKSRCRTVVILIEELHPYAKHLAERCPHAQFFLHGPGRITVAANVKGAQVAAAFEPDMAEEMIEFTQRSGHRCCHMHPVRFGVTPF